MQVEGIEPDGVTLLLVLAACGNPDGAQICGQAQARKDDASVEVDWRRFRTTQCCNSSCSYATATASVWPQRAGLGDRWAHHFACGARSTSAHTATTGRWRLVSSLAS
ncbi:hypothetical protein Zm00014a_019151 [Zea mays]|jgi:hypothetical protein|uniref:Uncharacterized protein n=1 Tax=Zea mays TaxID=4577 RepID=A0A3L6DFH3_MAIZE|nr:hypothetical protein Zm00014a_019151 [Zea mays]